MTYTLERFEQEAASWRAAADAFRRCNAQAVADQFSPLLQGEESHARTITMAAVGAILCAQEIARLSGHALGDPAVSYDLVALTPDAWDDRNQVCAVQAVSCAANADFGMVADLLCAHIPPNGIEECGVLIELLTIYVDLVAQPGGVA